MAARFRHAPARRVADRRTAGPVPADGPGAAQERRGAVRRMNVATKPGCPAGRPGLRTPGFAQVAGEASCGSGTGRR